MNTNIGRRLTLGLVVTILLLAGCNPAAAPIEATITSVPTKPPGIPIIIDSDMGSNGIMALAYILQRPEFDILAVTVSGTGEAHCSRGTEDAVGLINLTNAGDIPVACGRETPLKGTHKFPDFIREKADGDKGIDLNSQGVGSDLSASQEIQAVISQSPQPVVVITDGPLTNLAEALLAEPELVKNIQMIYIMGGAIDVPGNLFGVPQYSTEVTAEFNIFVDPYAAGVVINSGAPITLVPLDVTNQVPLDEMFYRLLEKNRFTIPAKAIFDMLTYTKSYQEYGMYFWDPLTYVIAKDDSLATYVTKKIKVIEEGDEIGRTKVTEDGREVRIAVAIDPDSFMELYLSGLNRGQKVDIDWAAARATPTPPPNALIVTIEGDQCSLQGSMQVDSPDLAIILINKEVQKLAGLAVATIDDDKTIEDLEAWTSVDQPPWLQVVNFIEAKSGRVTQSVTPFVDKPFFLVCFNDPPPMLIGVFGPIERK